MIGRDGYFIDVSRTYLCGDVEPTAEQRDLYRSAYEFVHGNIPDMVAGRSFAELGERMAARFPAEYYARRYLLIGHGAGLCDEYPAIKWETHHDGELQVGMVMCLEAYCGRVGGRDGVKLEEQLVVTDDGPEIISSASAHEERLLA
jgi:Xaa-Pro aminopeptidase